MSADPSYADTLHYLYRLLPDFQRTGKPGGKIDLRRTRALCAALGDPQDRLRCIHVAGTNGKGTVSHLLASFATASGLRTGLYTSPHYLDFRERIRVDGELVPERWVVEFVATHRPLIERTGASFFEFTVAMAFAYFAERAIDLAVIEVGMGGRLDSTNVLRPEAVIAAVITNIDLDHTEFLGDTRAAIAAEKAGIIKDGRPVIVGRRDDETFPVLERVAGEVGAALYAASDTVAVEELAGGGVVLADLCAPTQQPQRREYPTVGVHGPFTAENLRTAAAAWLMLVRELGLATDSVQLPPLRGVAEPDVLSGYRGRFLTLRQNPLVIADAGHNPAAWRRIGDAVGQLAGGRPLLVVCGFVRGKDVAAFFTSFPVDASFFVGAPDLPRAVPAPEVVSAVGSQVRLATPYASVGEAYEAAMTSANPTDVVFVGGSTFVVGALFEHLNLPPR